MKMDKRLKLLVETALWGIFLGPIIIHGILSSYTSGYPSYFFNVDNAWTLQFVHALEQDFTYPPRNISVDFIGSNYQYGVVYLAFLFQKIPYVTPHLALYLLVPLFFGLIAIVLLRKLLLLRNMRDTDYLLGIFVIVSLRYNEFLWNPMNNFFEGFNLEHGPFYIAQSIQLQAFSGYVLLIVMIYLMVINNGGLKTWVLLRFVFITIIIFKASYIFFFLAYLPFEYFRFRLRNFRRYLVLDILVLGLASFVLVNFVRGSTEIYDSYVQLSDFRSSGNYVQLRLFGLFGLGNFVNFSLFLLPLLFVMVNSKTDSLLILTGLFMFMMFNFVYLDSYNKHQLYAPLRAIVPVIYAMNISLLKKDRLTKFFGIIFIIYYSLPNLIGGTLYMVRTAGNPMSGHEVVDNTQLAEVLGCVPLDNSVVITNDLRYPADNYKRVNRQMQLSSLFGHTFYNAELTYIATGFPGTVNERILFLQDRHRLTNLLCNGEVKLDEVSKELKIKGVSHVLIHKGFNHLNFDESGVLCENEKYAVIQLSNE